MRQDWQYIIQFYQDWGNNEPEILPLFELAKKIAESEFAEEFYACTSVGVLCISGGSNYSSNINSPTISIQYLRNQFFKIIYAPNLDTNLLEKHKCHYSQVFTLLESLFLRLRLESAEIKNV